MKQYFLEALTSPFGLDPRPLCHTLSSFWPTPSLLGEWHTFWMAPRQISDMHSYRHLLNYLQTTSISLFSIKIWELVILNTWLQRSTKFPATCGCDVRYLNLKNLCRVCHLMLNSFYFIENQFIWTQSRRKWRIIFIIWFLNKGILNKYPAVNKNHQYLSQLLWNMVSVSN